MRSIYDPLVKVISSILDLQDWNYIHVKIGVKDGTTEFFFPNPNRLPEKKESIKERVERLLKNTENWSDEDNQWWKDCQLKLAEKGFPQIEKNDPEDVILEKLYKLASN